MGAEISVVKSKMWGCDLLQNGVQITAILGNMNIFAT